jgi:hypothetical protein
MHRLLRGLLVVLMGLPAAATPLESVRAVPDELPLEGSLLVTPGDNSVTIGVDYAPPAGHRIAELRVELSGPTGVLLLHSVTDVERVGWFGERRDLAPGSWTVTVRAEVTAPDRLLSGTTSSTVEVGVLGPLPGVAPPRVEGPVTDRPGTPDQPGVTALDDDVRADVVVYGATPSGVLAAVSAARQGATVALVEATPRVGGMMTNGLTATDYGHPGVLGGWTKEFFDRTQAAEGSAYGRWRFQPSTAESVFLAMLDHPRITLYPEQPLAESDAVTMAGAHISAIRTVHGRSFAAHVFVDASYEGDLMAAAGVSYRVGREAATQTGESRAGVRPSAAIFTVPAGIDPAFPVAAPGGVGTGDGRVQVSNYRLCFSTRADRVPFEAPEGYDPSRYDIVAAYIDWRAGLGHVPDITWFLWPVALANGKYDVNNNSYVSIGVPGANADYPDGSRSEREQATAWLQRYTQGFLHFLADDPRVPQRIRTQMTTYGLCADEHVANDHWPEMFYLREGRRMLGRYVLSERDIELYRTKPDTIGIGSYPFDAHHVSRWIAGNRALRVEGGFWTGRPTATRWSIPYRALTPQPDEAANLLVSVAASTTHVAWAAFRLEPQYMLTGEAAGTAAALVATGARANPGTSVSVQQLDVTSLQATLRSRGSVVDNFLFWDIQSTPFRGDIEASHLRGITFGCTPTTFCPADNTTREVMAAWLANALRLPPASRDYFDDDEASAYEDSINRVAEAGVTGGCEVRRYCPAMSVTRGQMAAFLVRAFRLPPTTRDYFTDDNKSIFRNDINSLAASGITAGCGRTNYCPHAYVIREQMAAFLWRAVR